MSKVIKKQFKTKYTKNETREIINKLMQEVSLLKSIVERIEWQDDALIFVSKIGDGYFLIADYLVSVEINLNFMGSMAKDKIEEMLDTEIIKLKIKK
ncbi:hypothetical protein SDC9_211838 [bioreactor metagenome]|uniref:Polyhydroxyalkanoic acid system protein n=1 Tax=bioreactor metagenome TaxID=1076179 RepID=A0A645JL38_9ZZZZ